MTEGAGLLRQGQPLDRAASVLVLVHGRGATAEDILMSCRPLLRPGWAFLAPQAPGYSWYPRPFTEPLDANEPWLSNSLEILGRAMSLAARRVGNPRTVLLGFSQGACLASEYTARNPQRYGAVASWSGGLIGPDGTPRNYSGGLDGTPVFLGCGDRDPHIPVERVQETAHVLRCLGGDVDLQIYPGMGHQVNADEFGRVGALLAAAEAGAPARERGDQGPVQ